MSGVSRTPKSQAVKKGPVKPPTWSLGMRVGVTAKENSMEVPLDSVLKSRNITLPKKVHLVKAMVLPVVMYGCDSRTIKKHEHRRTDAFKLRC